MKVLFVEQRDTYIGVEFSLKQAGMLLDFLDHCEVSGVDKETDKYVRDFFKRLDELCNDLEKMKEMNHGS